MKRHSMRYDDFGMTEYDDGEYVKAEVAERLDLACSDAFGMLQNGEDTLSVMDVLIAARIFADNN